MKRLKLRMRTLRLKSNDEVKSNRRLRRLEKDAEAGGGQYREIRGMQREPVPHHKGEI